MPRVTSLPSPAIAGLPQPTLHRPLPAPFSFRQAQLLWRVPAWLLGTSCILAHPCRLVKCSYVPGHKYRFCWNQQTTAAGHQPDPLQPGIMSAEYYSPWDSRKASTRLLNNSGLSSISMCPTSGTAWNSADGISPRHRSMSICFTQVSF